MLLIDTFLNKLQQTATKVNTPLAISGLQGIIQAARLSDKIIFSDSTMRMLMEKIQYFEETLQEIMKAVGEVNIQQLSERILSFRGVWIEFHKPIDDVAAMLSFVPSVYLKTGRDQQHLYLVSKDAVPVDALECTTGRAWRYLEPLHQCSLCKKEHGVLLLCETCRVRLEAWSRIMPLSAIIAGQYLAAHRYEERAFTSIRHVPRQKSSKERKVPVKHIFKVIDANEILVQVPIEQEIQREEKHGSWFDGTEVYEEIRTRPFTRTYHHPRYVNVQGQTVEFPEGILRLQPRKAAHIGKHVTKVKASLYEI